MKKGVTRLVFFVGNYAIKIPNFKNYHHHFLDGCLSNWSERRYCKIFKKMPKFYNKVAPSVFCSWFGLIQVQKRCIPLDRELTNFELKYFNCVRNGESKNGNFGTYKGMLVCLDYK